MKNCNDRRPFQTGSVLDEGSFVTNTGPNLDLIMDEWLQQRHTTEPSQKVLRVIKVKGIQKIRHCSVRWGRARQ